MPQPPPKPGKQLVFPTLKEFVEKTCDTEILDLIIERKKDGEAKYGVGLESFNGRDCVQDFEEELLDAFFYLTQAELEGKTFKDLSRGRRMLELLLVIVDSVE